MLDPGALYELEPDRPDLSGAVLLQALDGFVDAGSVAKVLREHLLAADPGRVVARFDVDQLHDYRARRPMMRFERDHWGSVDVPELVIRLIHDQNGTPLLLLTGPEPDVQWERFCAAAIELVDRLGVGLTVGFNAFPMGLPHTRPTRVILHGSRPELFEGYQPWLGVIGVPGSAGHLLELRLGQSGHDALGMAAPVPPYLAEIDYPAAAAALLREVNARTGLQLPVDDLDEAAKRTRVDLDAQVAQSEEVASVVKALEEQYDSYLQAQAEAGTDESLLAGGNGLPSADELAAEFERFLADQRRGENPPS